MVRLRMAAAIAAMWEQTVCAQTLCGFAAGFGVTRTRAHLASLPFSICGTLVELCHMSIIDNSHMRKFKQSVKKKERKAGSAKLPNWARSAHRLKPSATVTTGVAHARPAAYAHRPRCGRVRDCSTLRLQTLARLDSPFSARLPTPHSTARVLDGRVKSKRHATCSTATVPNLRGSYRTESERMIVVLETPRTRPRRSQ